MGGGDQLSSDNFYMMCGYDGNTCCFRIKGTSPGDDLFTLDVRNAGLFDSSSVVLWNELRAKLELSPDKPIQADIVTRNMRPTFTTDHGIIDENDRVKMLRFWRDNNLLD